MTARKRHEVSLEMESLVPTKAEGCALEVHPETDLCKKIKDLFISKKLYLELHEKEKINPQTGLKYISLRKIPGVIHTKYPFFN